ncbi:30S ribosomal protein S9 [Candidatus Peregrinibacteria bacterium]|nr:30S ribosomal protein S9 [Candidatus Peregrinibacteria bacterium]
MTEELKFKGTYFYANGKRKTAVARVRLYKGNGRIVVNGKDAKDYFSTVDMVNVFMAPLLATNNAKNFDISAVITGGGMQAHSEALRHGISKALVVAEAGNRQTLKPLGFLTRDSRVKERKKYGLHKARRAPQFSKR